MTFHKLRVGFAVLLVLGGGAVGTKLFLWPTHANEFLDTGHARAMQPEANSDPAQAKAGDKEPVQANQRTRRDFAAAMAKIKEGMPEKDILAILGKPDDTQTQYDGGGISTYRTKEVWRYGTNGHLTFPTLGCVYIDTDGKAQYIYGGLGQPPDPGLLPEAELLPLLRLIDQAPSYGLGYHYDPLAVIRIVNALQPLGKEKALTAIDEYLRVATHFHSAAREGLFLVLRVLFEVPTDPGYMPKMGVGEEMPSQPADAKRIPRFPILLEDDIPLLLVRGYNLGGEPERAERHVAYFRAKGTLRERRLTPANTPLGLLGRFTKTTGQLYDDTALSDCKLLIANQLLHLLDSVYRREEERGLRFQPGNGFDNRWKTVMAEVEKLDIRWSAEKGRYTFKDGSHLPDQVRKLYRRDIWKLQGLNDEATLIIERTGNKQVSVCLQRSWKKGAEWRRRL